MASYSWNVVGGGAWGTATNWTPNGTPTTGDTATIAQNITANVTITTGSLASFPQLLSVSDTNGTHAWDIGAAGNVITLTSNLEINTPVRATPAYDVFTNPTLNGAFAITKTGPGTWGTVTNVASTTTGTVIQDGGFVGGYVWYATGSGKYVEFGSAAAAPTGTIYYNLGSTSNQTVTFPIKFVRDTSIINSNAGSITFSGPVVFVNGITLTTTASGGVTISGAITGTAGFTKAGAGRLTLNGSLAGLTGTISQNQTTSGQLVIDNTSFTTLVGGTTISVAGPADYGASGNRMLSLTPTGATSTIQAGVVFSGTGAIEFAPTVNSTGSGHTFPAGALSLLTGTSAPSTTTFLAPSAGLLLSTGNSATGASLIATVNDLPSVLSFYVYQNTASLQTRTFYYTGAAGSFSTRLDVVSAFTGAGAISAVFYANHAAGVLTLTEGIRRYEQTGQSRTATLTLRGNSEAVISGNIEQISGAPYGSGVLAITKADSNKWIFSGTNTYTGANTVSAGTLVASNNSALGAPSGTASSIATGATLEIPSGITVNKASTQWTLNGNTAANGAVYAPSGNAGLTAANFVLGTATTDIKADAGATLTLTSAGAISGDFTLRHIGTGTVVLAQTAASTFNALNIQSGTVSVSAALAAGGVSSGIGDGAVAASNWLIGSTATAGTFRYTGAASSTNRNFTIGTAGSTFDASGSGVLTLTGTTPAFSAANTACTLTLAGTAGTSATPNTSAMVLPDNTQPVGLTKTGTGAWKFTASQTYTGATTITGGSMSFGETNIATNVVFNGPGILREVVLNGVSKTITCSAGASDVAELIATSSHNTITGSTNITTGTLKLTTEATAATKPVKVLGDTNVSVTGKLQTSTGTLQRGQMRYGGDLTFQAGSTFIIGG